MAVRKRGRSKRFLLGASLEEEQWRKLAWLVINRGDNGFEGGGVVVVGEVGGETRAGKGLKEWPVCAVVIDSCD